MNLKIKAGAIAIGLLFTACGENSKIPQVNTMDTAKPEAISTVKSTVMSSGDLKGLYINAGDDSPIVLIVPGSGPTDLDGNNPMGVNSNTYKMLAEGLSHKGISTVRVDKRGMFTSKAAGNPNAVTLDIYAQDYRNWAKAIKAETGRSCVYMLGHSEGGLMVTAASIDNENVCGLILVSAPGRSFGDILREQLKANPANIIILKEANAAIDTLESGKKVNTSKLNSLLKPLFNDSVQGFLI